MHQNKINKSEYTIYNVLRVLRLEIPGLETVEIPEFANCCRRDSTKRWNTRDINSHTKFNSISNTHNNNLLYGCDVNSYNFNK